MAETSVVAGKRQRHPSAMGESLDGFSQGLTEVRGTRTAHHYVGAAYPCTVYECEDEYAAVSPACPSSIGSSWTSAQEAIDDLRARIENDIREITEKGRDWWERSGDNKQVPLPNELPSTPEEELDGYLRNNDFDILRKWETTVTVFRGDEFV